jgi:hypothetical protein
VNICNLDSQPVLKEALTEAAKRTTKSLFAIKAAVQGKSKLRKERKKNQNKKKLTFFFLVSHTTQHVMGWVFSML